MPDDLPTWDDAFSSQPAAPEPPPSPAPTPSVRPVQPESPEFDAYVRQSPIGGVMDAFGHDRAESDSDGIFQLSDETTQALKQSGVHKDLFEGQVGLVSAFDKGVLRTTAGQLLSDQQEKLPTWDDAISDTDPLNHASQWLAQHPDLGLEQVLAQANAAAPGPAGAMAHDIGRVGLAIAAFATEMGTSFAKGAIDLLRGAKTGELSPEAVNTFTMALMGGAAKGGIAPRVTNAAPIDALSPGVNRALGLTGLRPAILGAEFGTASKPFSLDEQLAAGRATGVIGEGEAGWLGTSEPTPAQVQARNAASAKLPAPPEEPTASPDIHAVARQAAPEVFEGPNGYDALIARQDTYRRWIDELDEKRRADAEASPEAVALRAKIDELTGRVGGRENELTRAQAARVAEARARLDALANPAGDTPDMAQVRKALQENDYRLRDLAPKVSEAYRTASEHFPEAIEPEGAAPAAAEPVQAAPLAEAAAQPEPAAVEPAPQPAAPAAPIAGRVQAVPSIKADMVQKLVAAGRPAEEAEAAGQLLEEHYKARATRFGGALGMPEELYTREAPAVRVGKRTLVDRITGTQGYIDVPELAQKGARVLKQEGQREYPIAPRSEWYGDANYEQTGGRMTSMTPDEFLDQARPMKIDEVARENIDDLKRHIESGKTLDPLAFYKNGKEDGRHRAIAAKELGIDRVPVLDFREELHQSDEGMFGPPETVEELKARRRRDEAVRLLEVKVRESKIRRPGQESVKDQEGGLFSADRDQKTLFQAADATDTPEFKNWFGDSKVVDEEGQPQVVYKAMHPYDWTKETPDDLGPEIESINRPSEFPSFKVGEPGIKIAGFFGDKETANRFTAVSQNAAVYPVYLKMEKPLVIDAAGKKAGEIQFGTTGQEFRDGIRSGKYDGAIIKNTADEGTVYVPLKPEQIKSIHNRGTFETDNPRILEQQAKGKITLRDSRNIITLFKNADASTFVHETGHQWLEELLKDAGHEAAPADVRADAATVRKWLGANGDAEIKRAQHEKFARGFERYLMEGVAPSKQLAGVFAKFKSWLTQIYQTVQRLRSPITDDIRDVFDRLLSANPEKTVIAPERELPGGFDDRHEATAERTPPEHAAVIADRIQGELDRHIEERLPNVHADLTAAHEAGGINAPNGNPPGGANAAGALGGGDGNAAPGGALAASNNAVAPQGGGIRGPAEIKRDLRKTPLMKVPALGAKSFMRWAIERGGIKDTGGDLAAMYRDAGKKPPVGLIANKNGTALDVLARRAQEAGYIKGDYDPLNPEELTQDHVLDMIRDHIEGKPTYSIHDIDNVQAHESAKAFNEEIKQLAGLHDIDYRGMTADEFHAAVAEKVAMNDLAESLGIDRTNLTDEEFKNAVAERISVDEQARLAQERDAAADVEMQEAMARAEDELGDAWEGEPTEHEISSYRTLEDLERDAEQGKNGQPAGEGTGDAGEVPANVAGDAGDVPGSDSGERAAGDVAGKPGGESRPGNITEPPAGPNTRFDGPESDLIDKAGNIRLDNLGTPEDVNAVIREAAAKNDDFLEARRGVISDAQALDLADAIGMDASLLNFRKIGQAFNAEQILAARKLLVQSATHVRDLMSKAGRGSSDADVIAYAEAKARHRMIQQQVAGITAEAGRALRAFRKIAGSDEAMATDAFLKEATGKTLFQLREEAQMGMKLETPSQVSKFINDTATSRLKGMVIEYYVNALISGPITHLRYAAGNALNALWTPLVELPTAAAVGSARSLLGMAAEDRIYWGEVGAQLYGLGKGSRDGLSAAIQAWKSGVSPLLPGERYAREFPTVKVNSIPGAVGRAINIPGKGVSAIHSFFKSLRYEQNIQALAYRSAMADGLDGEGFANRVAQLTQHPTPEMMQAATGDALKELFMAPTDYHSAMGALNRFTNQSLIGKIMVPFMKIGTQITRNAFVERTPIGIFSKEVRENLMGVNGGAAQQMQMAKMTAGMALIGTTVMMAAEGMATGDGPTDPKQRAAWLLTHTPNTIMIGSVSIPYQGLGHLGMLMRFAANSYETAHSWDGDSYSKLAVSVLEGLSQSVLDENFMRGVKDMLDAVYHPQQYGANYLRNFAANWLPFSVGLGQTAREIDPWQRQANDFFDTVRRKVPFISQTLHQRFDMFGNPVRNDGPNPNYANNPVVQEMDRLKTGISPVGKKIRGVQLTDDQYEDYATTAGRLTYMRLSQIMGTPGWLNVPAGLRHKVFTETVNGARESARSLVMMRAMKSDNNIVQKATAAKLDILKPAEDDIQ